MALCPHCHGTGYTTEAVVYSDSHASYVLLTPPLQWPCTYPGCVNGIIHEGEKGESPLDTQSSPDGGALNEHEAMR